MAEKKNTDTAEKPKAKPKLSPRYNPPAGKKARYSDVKTKRTETIPAD